ncbi:formylglycine-generating enzyme family protein [Mycobacterium sp. M26]|uniref:formylglycine-generating enzyme family protein n=1 Tax=Mycobacterium sp. M26 TaxID=1762962 RepID=UPI00073F122F|nr:formylglycine-generating enzyme family protein [Mycobacterium sp. M26]
MLGELVELPGGSFRMGSVSFYPEEAPIHTVTVAPFAIERHPVTNAAFAEFVADTGYVTVAERPLDPALYPGVAEADLLPGSLIFRPTPGPVNLSDWRQWWDWAPGAHWRQPFGAGSDIVGKDDHPVVQVAYPDAAAYAAWAGRRLPSEAEWEYAARAGSDTTYAWGEEPTLDGALMANTWQGRFPYRNDGALGWVGTSPVGTFPANGFGLVDMIGNVWEWTTTRFAAHHLGAGAQRLGGQAAPEQKSACCPPPVDPDPSVNQALKGGSHLCAPEYCHRYRPAARSPQSQDSSTTHIGFRCVVSRT